MIPEGLPAQFLNWRIEIDEKGDPQKVPFRLSDGRRCSAHDPANWITYEQALASGHGVAFAITENDPWFFLDLDKCLDESGQWTAEATAIYQSFAGAWGELSQSGKGLHIMGWCDKSKLADRKNKWDGWLEFYIKERFIAFGGHGWQRINGAVNDIDWTNQLLNLVPQREFLGDLPDGIDERYTGPADDGNLLNMAMRSQNTASAFGEGVTFKDLWEATPNILAARWPSFNSKDPFDRSSADMALMCQLAFWTGKDMPRMDRLFRQSGLMRPKYEQRQDYRHDTIQKAARLTQKVYDVPQKSNGKDYTDHEAFLSIPEMEEYFDGCVYIRDQNGILVPDGSILRKDQFNSYYGGHLFTMMDDGTRPSREAFTAFTQNTVKRFPKVKSTMFRPEYPPAHIIDDKVNVYVKPEIETYPGDISRFTDFLERLLPDPNDRAILIAYCASVVQNPGHKMQWAPVIQGTEGNGKTMLAECVAYCVGEQYVHMPSASQMGEKYNGYVENMLLVIIEEVAMRGKMEMLDVMKPLITNRRIEIRRMATDKYMIDNRANFFMCTNHKDAIIKTMNDRRYSILYTGQQSVEDLVRDGMDGMYFPDMYRWLNEEGGFQMVGHWLQNYQIPAHLDPAGSCHRAPTTSATAEAIAISRSPIEYEILEAAQSGRLGFKGGWINMDAFDELVKMRNVKMTSHGRIDQILDRLGYRLWGRSEKPLMPDMTSPMIWVMKDHPDPTFQNFCQANAVR